MHGWIYTVVVTLHLLGAAVWVGGHLVLSLGFLPEALRRRDPEVIRRFESKFERIGIPALLVQVATGPLLAYRLIPDVSRWFNLENVVAAHISSKLFLLLATVLLAVHARLRIIPNLDESRLRVLAAHIIAVTVIAVLLLVTGVSFRT